MYLQFRITEAAAHNANYYTYIKMCFLLSQLEYCTIYIVYHIYIFDINTHILICFVIYIRSHLESVYKMRKEAYEDNQFYRNTRESSHIP